MGLFHITTRAAWTEATELGSYRPASLASEGFVHLSTDEQWLRSANRFFRGQAGLVLLAVRQDRLTARLVFEKADDELFPHLYGALNLDAVLEVHELPTNDDGSIGVPNALMTGKR